MRHALTGILMALSLVACQLPAPDYYVTDDRIPVKVVNRNWSDVTVYQVDAAGRTRLRRIGSMRTEYLRVSPGYDGVRLQLDVFAENRTLTLPAVRPEEGDRVEVEIQNYLPLSTIIVTRN